MTREPYTPIVSWIIFSIAWVVLILVLASLLGGCQPWTPPDTQADNTPELLPDGGIDRAAQREACLYAGGSWLTITEPGAAPVSTCSYTAVEIDP